MGANMTFNLALLGACYLYIIVIILITGKIKDRLPKNLARKFLHIMIGNFIWIIPFFTYVAFPLNFPFFVAAPFILLTFLVSPGTPIKGLTKKLSGLGDVTFGGHTYGLVFYAISYTILAAFFSNQPWLIAAGIIPLAYGDAAASIVGLKWGKHQFNICAKKSVEGSLTMFATCFLVLAASFVFFGFLYPLPITNYLLASLCAAAVATLCEALTPRGLDNLAVPILSAAVFLLLLGGF
jgi:dolichol kinase